MANGIRIGDPRGFNKGCSLKFRAGSRVRQTPEEGWRTYRPKGCGNNNKDEDNSPKTLNDINQQASSQKFRQMVYVQTKILPRKFMKFSGILRYKWITQFWSEGQTQWELTKKSCHLMDFSVTADQGVKMKESKKLLNIKVTIMPIVVSVLGTVLKDLEKRLEELKIRERIVTIEIAVLLRSARIIRIFLKI